MPPALRLTAVTAAGRLSGVAWLLMAMIGMLLLANGAAAAVMRPTVDPITGAGLTAHAGALRGGAQPLVAAGLPAEAAPVAPPLTPLAPQVAPPVQPAVTAALPPAPLAQGGARLAAFAGLSTWIDLYDTGIAPRDQAEIAAANGVQTLFVQSARFNSPADIHDPARLGELIESAHDLGMRVMIWYIPDHLSVEHDLRRAQAAIAFTTPRGDHADAFGLDVETEFQADVTTRTAQLLELSAALRAWTGPHYPMAAIVLPPLQLDLRPSWWPAFPYEALTTSFDVFVPMSYSSYRGVDAMTTYQWNLANVRELRVRAGDPDLVVHLAGGIANQLPEVAAFVQAAADAGVVGAGLYDLHTTPPAAWPALQSLRAN